MGLFPQRIEREKLSGILNGKLIFSTSNASRNLASEHLDGKFQALGAQRAKPAGKLRVVIVMPRKKFAGIDARRLTHAACFFTRRPPEPLVVGHEEVGAQQDGVAVHQKGIVADSTPDIRERGTKTTPSLLVLTVAPQQCRELLAPSRLARRHRQKGQQ